MKKLLFILAAFFLAFAINCFAEENAIVISNHGLKLSIPTEYAGKLLVEIPEIEEGKMFFSISEKASIEAAKAMGETENGAGWLFGIGSVDEETYHEMLCGDMSGVQVFAKDTDGNYYLYYHPTDVRLVREDYTYMDDAMKEWGYLNEWTHSALAAFVEENGLTHEKHGNTMPDIYLARLMYHEGENYTVSTNEYGPMEPNGVKAADFVEPLVNGVTFKYLPDKEAPDGQYVVLNFPDDDVRLDFFFLDGKENYVRMVWGDDKFEELLLAEFDDEGIKASTIMNDLYHAMARANGLR